MDPKHTHSSLFRIIDLTFSDDYIQMEISIEEEWLIPKRQGGSKCLCLEVHWLLKPSPSVFQLVTKLDFLAPIPPAQDTNETALALMPLPAHLHWLPESAFPARIAKAASSVATTQGATLTFRYSLPCSQPNEYANGSLDILFCFCLFSLYPPLRLSFLISSWTKPVSRPVSHRGKGAALPLHSQQAPPPHSS